MSGVRRLERSLRHRRLPSRRTVRASGPMTRASRLAALVVAIVVIQVSVTG